MKKLLLAGAIIFTLVFTLGAPAFSGQEEYDEEYDVVVIGGGGGGLAAAATLSQSGLKVLLLEQHVKVGGYMTNFERGDFVFEVSLHALDGLDPEVGMNSPMLKKLGVYDRLDWVRLPIPYRSVYPGFTLAVPDDPEQYRELLITKFPLEKRGINKFFRHMERMARAIEALRALEQGDSLRAGLIMLKNPTALVPMMRYESKSVSVMLDDYVKDPQLQAVLSWLCYYSGTPPDKMSGANLIGMWTSYHYGGWWYPRGGSQAISNAMARVIEENGGRIEVSTLVTRIIIENGRAVAVEDQSGKVYKTRYVVSNASAPATFNTMVGRENLPPEFLAKLDRLEIGPSAFVAYLGVDKDYTGEFAGAHAINLEQTCDRNQAFGWFQAGEIEKIPFILVNYSTVDPGAAPPGKNIISITTYLPYDWQNGWHEKESYQKYRDLKEKVAWTLIRRAESVLPGLSNHVEVLEVGSPRTMEHFTLNPRGAIYGYANTIDNPDNHLSIPTPIPNLFLAGAWSNYAGQNGVMRSGVEAAKLIIEDLGQGN